METYIVFLAGMGVTLYNEETTSSASTKNTAISIAPHLHKERGRTKIKSADNIGKHIVNVSFTLNKNSINDTAR